MFGLFRSKPTEKDAIVFVEQLANKIVVEALLDAGRYVAFTIHVNKSGSSLAPYFAHDAARLLFVQVVELLIEDCQFAPQLRINKACDLSLIGYNSRHCAVRVLVASNNVQLMQWNRPTVRTLA